MEEIKSGIFLCKSNLNLEAGIRGTQFGLSADADSTELAVLEGRVGFLDAIKARGDRSKGCRFRDGAGEVDALADSESTISQGGCDSQNRHRDDLTRLANTVDGYDQAELHRKVRPRYGTDLVSTQKFY